MSDFAKALPYTLDNEGGFVDDHRDKGGATFQGITIPMLRTYLQNPLAGPEVLMSLSPEQVADFYKRIFWDSMHLDLIQNQEVATAIFDMGVNRGCKAAVTDAQCCISGPMQDGIMGPMTANAINALRPAEFLIHFQDRCTSSYLRNKNSPFLVGWINRARKMSSLILQAL